MTDYLVRSSALQGIRPTLEELDADADTLLAQAGLLGVEGEEEAWISYRSFLWLLEEAAEITGCQHFGLRLSQHQDIGILGAVGFVIQQAPDLRTALRELAVHFAHHNQGATTAISVEGTVAYWRFNCKLDGLAPISQQSDLAAGLGVDLMRLLRGNAWTPQAVYLPHSRPADIRPYKHRFRCPVVFDGDGMSMAFDASMLDLPISEANPQLYRVLDEYLRLLHKNYSDDYRGRIRHLIQQALSTGDCSIERIAGFLAINTRTLQRRLRAENTSYQELLNEVRFNIARRYLRESSGSLTTLADMLCYRELSVFSSAFRRHHGMSPRVWRQQQGQG